ncbi:12739_t:CDS:2, partial [Acaulospora colombiana]
MPPSGISGALDDSNSPRLFVQTQNSPSATFSFSTKIYLREIHTYSVSRTSLFTDVRGALRVLFAVDSKLKTWTYPSFLATTPFFEQSTPMIVQPEPPSDRQRENNEAYADDDSHGSDRDAPADEDIDMIETEQNAAAAASTHGSEMDEAGAEDEVDNTNPISPTSSPKRVDRKTPSTEKVSAATLQARARLRTRSNLKRKEQTPEDLESEEDDGMERNLEFSDSEQEGEDELDSDAEPTKGSPRKARMSSAASKKVIKNVKDLPVYAQHAYVASTFGLPKLPVPMVLLPGLRSRKPPPIPVPDLTKRSRGRHVSAADDDAGRKRFARGEHLKRHIRSIHTHEK